jgi:hypothetical protein
MNVADGYLEWSATYARKFGDAFAIQKEISNLVAKSLSDAIGATHARQSVDEDGSRSE